MSSARTRFAPSPTGFLHVGGIRTALFAYLVARQAGGQFVLRLEDTDQKREVEGSAEHLIKSLNALDLVYDEGPDIGGPYGPYKQSERLEIYKSWAQKLIDAGRAYADPYTPEQVQKFREEAQAQKKPFLYRNHRPENSPAWDGTTPLRFKSDPKAYTWHDEVMGDLSSGEEVIDDFILIKSDGYPTYNFAHIVDDAEMHITHVIRGQEFLSSMPNYLNLYEALGFDMTPARVARGGAAPPSTNGDEGADRATGPADSDLRRNSVRISDDGSDRSGLHLPVFATMPHILNEQGNKKLSKRDGAKDVLDYLTEGYLPEALVSFIATLGWNDGTEQEVFTRQQLIDKFSLDRVGRSGARFDERRLLWVNGQVIRELPLDELTARVEPFWSDNARKASPELRSQVLVLAQDRLKTLADLPGLTEYFFSEPRVDLPLIDDNKQLAKLSREEQANLLTAAQTALEACEFTPEALQETLNQLLETTSQKPGILFSLIRIATTWAPFSPQLNDTLAILGRDTALARLERAINSL